MKTIVVYGSTMGNTESAAQQIGQALGGEVVEIASLTEEQIAQAELLVLGTSTWGIGELQDDWVNGVTKLNTADLSGKKVALFGLGDQVSYADSFVDGMGLLFNAAKSRGAEIIGDTATDGYEHSHSEAEVDGRFVGLALDEDNQPELTADRIAAWVGNLT